MSVVTTYRCDAPGCSATHSGRPGGAMPNGWTMARGYVSVEDRRAGRGYRPVQHFCRVCSHKRDVARATLGRKRMRVS